MADWSTDSQERVASLVYSPKFEKVFCSGAFRLNIPPTYDKYMEWGFTDASVRFYHTESKKLIGHNEHIHQGQLSCAKFADSKTLITAGTDGAISVWALKSTAKSVELIHRSTLFNHVTPVMTMALSRSFSTLVTASNDLAVSLWDLNRLRFIRHLPTPSPITCLSVNDVSGEILLCAGQTATIFTINGAILLRQNICESSEDAIVSCAFYEGFGNEWLERELVFTGHKRGIVNIWQKRIGKLGGFELLHVKRLQHVNQFQSEIVVQAAITEVLPMPAAVYTGDEMGRVVCPPLFALTFSYSAFGLNAKSDNG